MLANSCWFLLIWCLILSQFRPRSHQAAGSTRQTDIVPKAHTKSDQEEQDLTEDEDDDVENVNVSTDIYEELEQEQEAKHKTFVLKFGANKSRELTPKSLSHSQHAAKNPFKVRTTLNMWTALNRVSIPSVD